MKIKYLEGFQYWLLNLSTNPATLHLTFIKTYCESPAKQGNRRSCEQTPFSVFLPAKEEKNLIVFWGQIRYPSHMISVVTRCYPGHAIASPCLISPHRGGSRIFHRRGCISNGVTDPQRFFAEYLLKLNS